LLIPIEETETAYDGKWFHGQGNWARIDNRAKNIAIKYMQNIHELNITNSLTVNEYGITTAKNFSWKNTGRKILNVI
jgi:branched-subunit amino acid aminotransferase/4-amino-4-deoxychorismate lyase